MSNYTKSVNFATKDGLISGNPLKLVRGTEIDTEFNAIATAIATKIDGSLVFAPDGNAAQPSYGFTNNAGTGMYNAAGVLGFATGATSRLTLSATGALVLSGAASSSVALTINAAASARGLQVNGSASNFTIGCETVGLSAGTSDGLLVTAGTNSADTCVLLRSQSGTSFLKISGDGGTTLGTPTGGSQGTGSLNLTAAGGLYIDGNQLFFGSPALASAAPGVTAVGQTVNTTGNIQINNGVFSQGHCFNIYNNSGAAITILGTITTMRLAGTATTGNRTLAGHGMAAVWFESGTECVIGGSGVT